MKELSLHIMDIIQNSIKAKADLIKVIIKEETLKDELKIKIIDNGVGISKENLPSVNDPFYTSRNTRKVGLGLSLFQMAAIGCDGRFRIWSKVGVGTIVIAVFKYSHIDRAPMGNLLETLIAALVGMDPKSNLIYVHYINDRKFLIDTREIKNILGEDIPLQSVEVLSWIKTYVIDGVKNLMEV